MAILIDENTRCLIQGITGKEGQKALEWMTNLGSVVVAGVTPGKGGQEVAGTPVYDSVAQALQKHPEINATSIYAPPRFVLSAVKEAIQAEIPLIHIIAENIPTRDTVEMLEIAKDKSLELGKQIRIVGPSSIGVLSPGKSAMGSLGAGSLQGIKVPNKSGGVVILAKSGGMSLTICHMISANSIAVTTVVGLGGDKISCTTYADLLDVISKDDETWAVVLIGEIGGSYEEDFAQAMIESSFNKPVIAFISGKFAENLPTGVAFGHAGAIVSKKFGTRAGKINELKKARALIAESPEDIVELLRSTK